ncbi:hypothetical protein GCM10023080_058200 [Streptomyces pseudoechinosporeus]
MEGHGARCRVLYTGPLTEAVRQHVRDHRSLVRAEPRGRMQTVLGNSWRLTGQAVRLPFGVAMAVPGAVFRGRGPATEH